MKIIKICALVLLCAATASCTLDNYAAPDSSLYGTIIDSGTGEPLQCDIYNGTLLHYYENGYSGLQNAVIKCDGSYCCGQMFAGDYKVVPVNTNFTPVDSVQVSVKGDTKLNFEVTPYFRIKDVTIIKSSLTKVTANFTVEQSDPDRGLMKVGLFVHQQPIVGAYMCQDSRETIVGGLKITSKKYTIVYDFSESTTVRSGKSYYFRVGALSDASNARYNYAPAELVEL